MAAGPFSDDAAVKAAEKLVAIYVDCTQPDQNKDIQEKYNVEGYPTVLFVTNDEKVIEDLYPEDGAEFAKQIEEIAAKHRTKPAAKSWISVWSDGVVAQARKDKKPVAIVFASKKDFSEWDDVQKWLKKELKSDFDKFVFAYSLPESDERKELAKRLGDKDGEEKARADSVVVLDPRAEKPFEKPLADPGKASEDDVIKTLKKALKDYKEKKK